MSFLKRTTRICPNCGMSVAEGNKYCEECGALYTAAKPSTVKLYCPNGHAVTSSEYTFCVVCSAKLVDTPPEPSKPIDPPIYVPVPGTGWNCLKCHVVNDESCTFCTSCGEPRERRKELPEEVPEIIGERVLPPDEVIISSTHERVIPDIPDIMRPLTNNDMKR